MVPLSHCAILISNLTVLLLHTMVPYFFLKFDGSIVTLSSTNIASDFIFVTFSGTLLFILKFDSSIVILGSTNITSDCIFSHSVVPYFFFLQLTVQLS